jgi:multiple sugar transport system permease protein
LIVAMLAYRLSKGWQDFARIAFYLPALAAGAISAQVWRWLFSQRGPANWLIGTFGIPPVSWFGQGETAIPIISLILSLSAMGSYVILLLAAMLDVDKSMIDAARMDGASEGKIMRSVIIPTIAPQIATCATLVAIGAPQIYETVNFLAPYDYAASATFAIYTEAFRSSRHGSAAAMAVMLALVTAGATMLKGRIRA